MKRFSKTVLAATLAVAMIAPVGVNNVYAKSVDGIIKDIEKDADKVGKDIKKDADKIGKDIKKDAEEVKDKVEEVVDKGKEKFEKEKAKEEMKKAVKDAEKAEKDEAKAINKVAETINDVAKEVKSSPQKVNLDGKEVKISGYNIDGNNYYRLRDLAAILAATDAKFNVEYKVPTAEVPAGLIILTPGNEYVVLNTDLKEVKPSSTAKETNDKVKIGDKDLKAKAYKIDGNNYYKLRDLADQLKFKVDYDKDKNTVKLTSKWDEIKNDFKEEQKKALEEQEKQEEKKADVVIGQPAPSEAAGPR